MPSSQSQFQEHGPLWGRTSDSKHARRTNPALLHVSFCMSMHVSITHASNGSCGLLYVRQELPVEGDQHTCLSVDTNHAIHRHVEIDGTHDAIPEFLVDDVLYPAAEMLASLDSAIHIGLLHDLSVPASHGGQSHHCKDVVCETWHNFLQFRGTLGLQLGLVVEQLRSVDVCDSKSFRDGIEGDPGMGLQNVQVLHECLLLIARQGGSGDGALVLWDPGDLRHGHWARSIHRCRKKLRSVPRFCHLCNHTCLLLNVWKILAVELQ
mmetsp:Transcript_11848/g.21672  ORF Transcript_11848/g.21672 Transcript_11848/m.21672 type:complete len:265 (-) Transcript_11848:425-1219(-)